MGWVVNVTPGLIYPRDCPGTYYVGGCVCPGPARTGADNLASTGIRNADRPVRSESLNSNFGTIYFVLHTLQLFCRNKYVSSDVVRAQRHTTRPSTILYRLLKLMFSTPKCLYKIHRIQRVSQNTMQYTEYYYIT
jgi:hypothetical protein